MERVQIALRCGLHAVCLFPAMHRYAMSDPRAEAVIKAAAGFGGRAVFVHCGVLTVGIRKKLGLPSPFDMRFSNPLDLHAIALRYPRLKFVLPHFGAGYLREALMLADLCPNVYLDTSSSNSWMRYEGLDLKTVFRRALDVVGAQRLLFGTDSSYLPARLELRDLRGADARHAGSGHQHGGRAPDYRRESAAIVRGVSGADASALGHSYATPHLSRFRARPARDARLASRCQARPRRHRAAARAEGRQPVPQRSAGHVTASSSPRSAGGQARFLQRRRLLVARPGESEGALHTARRHDQSG